MSYLICEHCGGYYELQPGESLNDFEGCSCGGKFKLVESLDDYYDTNPENIGQEPPIKEDKINESKPDTDKLTKKPSTGEKCPNCGAENNKGAIFCKTCGFQINEENSNNSNENNISNRCPYCAEEINPNAVKCKHCGEWLKSKPDKKTKTDNIERKILKLINWKAILIGETILLFLSYTASVVMTGPGDFIFVLVVFLSLIIPTIITGFLSGKEYLSGIVNAVLVGIFYSIIMALFVSVNAFKGSLNILPVIGILGGTFGVVIYRRLNNYSPECGTNLKENSSKQKKQSKKQKSSSRITTWWNNQGSGVKAAIIIVGICFIGFIAVVGVNWTSPSQIRAQAAPVDSDTLQQNAQDMMGDLISINGRVLQVGSDAMLIFTKQRNGLYIYNVVYVSVQGTVPNNIKEDDYITIYGVCNGRTEYESNGGLQIVPKVTVYPENILVKNR